MNIQNNAPLFFKGDYDGTKPAQVVRKEAKAQGCFKDILPNPERYDYSPLFTDPRTGSAKRKEYMSKIMDICFDKKGELNPAIKKHLDESLFLFDTKDGAQKLMTFKDAIKASIKGERMIDTNLYHATDMKETVQSIIKNGFDPQKIARTEFGPGFYFAGSEGEAMNYGSAKLTARIKGKCAHVDGKYYERVKTWKMQDKLKKFIGLNSFGYPTQEVENSVTSKIINEYARNILVNELGYDCAYGAEGGKACFVVYNPKAISDIKAM